MDTSRDLLELTAAELMSKEAVVLSETMPLREAARLLLQHQVSGAPVVDANGICVGVLSATDFLRLAERREDVTRPTAPPLPFTCSFQEKRTLFNGRDVTVCTLPEGVCPVQAKQKGPSGEDLVICRQPHCVLVDWQMVEIEKLPADEVRNFMTADPVTTPPETTLPVLARMMIDARVHRIIVVDEGRHPVGVVSTTDLVGAIAFFEESTAQAEAENDALAAAVP
jgi:CBS domain-containing protein